MNTYFIYKFFTKTDQFWLYKTLSYCLLFLEKDTKLRYNMKYVYLRKTKEKMETDIHKQLRTKKF